MASTNFVDNSSVIYASWLNNVNEAVYNGNFQATTLSPVNLVCNGSVSGTGFNGLVNSALGSPAAIGNGTPNTGAFTTLSSTGLATLNSINITNGAVSRNVDAAGYCYRLTPSASGTQSIIQWVNLAGSVQWTSLVGANNLLQCSTEFAATSFTGAGTGLTGTSNSLNAGLGVNQTWQNLTASRALGTFYPSNTKPIELAISLSAGAVSTTAIALYLNGNTTTYIPFGFNTNSSGGVGCAGTIIVPSGNTYMVQVYAGSGTLSTWFELR
jgi:hypothetical protein